jgi:hypothetical protein
LNKKIATLIAQALGLKVEDFGLGSFVRVSPTEAYEFATVTGASYCTNASFPFSPRPFSKIFGAALESSYTSGMLDQGIARYTTPQLIETRPYLANGTKDLYPLVIKNESDYRLALTRIIKEHPNPENVVVYRIESWKKGGGLEPILEYLAVLQFMARGFVTENQAPLSARLGSPDFIAFRCTELNADLHETLGLAAGTSLARINAYFAIENSTSRKFTAQDTDASNGQIVVGEAKVGGVDGFSQLDKYTSSGYFTSSVFLTDGFKQDTTGTHQTLSTANFTRPLTNTSLPASPISVDAGYSKWLEKQVLTHLIFAMPLEQRDRLLQSFSAKFHTESIQEVLAKQHRRVILEMIGKHTSTTA